MESNSSSDLRLQIDFAKEMSALLKLLKSSHSITEVNRDEVVSICDEFEKMGEADQELLERAKRVKAAIQR